MGGWKLEVGKMALYMSFPVGLFYIFNQPKYFEAWTVKMRQELYPPAAKMHAKVAVVVINCIAIPLTACVFYHNFEYVLIYIVPYALLATHQC